MAAEEVRVCRRAPVAIKQEQDDDSDAEEPNLGLKKSDGQIIHSGHFMVSSPHSEHPPKKGYDFDTVNMQTCQTYCFGKTSTSHFSIDASLTKLFECMTLAYSGKLVSPKWKNFKGLKLLWRDKIRLNNAIWRAWYMQYVEKRDNPVCHFVTPLDGSVDVEDHRRPEAIATEGKYWKRRIEIVIREYHKWRTYFKKRLQKHKDEDLSSLVKGAGEQYSLFGECYPDTFCVSFCQDDEVGVWRANRKGRDTPVPMEQDIDIEMLMSEFTDTLFSTLASHQPVAWPNPREIAHAGNADMIQPGLIPLQPNLDFMDTFEPFQDIFPSVRSSFFPSFSIPSVSSVASSSCPTQTSILTSPISSASLSQELIPPPVTPAVSNASNKNCSRAVNAFGQTAEFRSQTPVANQQTFLPAFPPLVTSVPCAADAATAPAPPSPPSQNVQPSAVPQNGAGGVTQATFPSAETPEFGFSSTLPSSVITHTASATLTHNAAAATFGQSPSLMLTTHPQAGLCDASVIPRFQPQPSVPAQTFAHPKPVKPKGIRTKQLQKIVPAPKPIVFKNTFIAPASFPGQSSAVIVTPAPLKSEGVSPPSVVLAPAAIGRNPGVTEFRILQPTVTSQHLIIAKDEPGSSTNCRAQTPSPTSNRERHNSGQGSLCASEQIPDAQSSQNSSTSKSKTDSCIVGFKSRRITHISAEQKRRFNIKMGFDTLNTLVPVLKSQSNSKPISNAATLQKTVEYIAKLQQERAQLQEEAKRLKDEIDMLNTSINSCQQQLPATGVPITRQRYDHMREMFDDYVKNRTLQNWKFWIFSIIIKPLFESFNGMVSTTSLDDMCNTTLSWLEEHCPLPVLRPMVLSTLRQLGTTTSILSDPSLLPEQATQAVRKMNRSGES
ncbi:MLX-interacting protein-like isoform X1 [Polyodon spathula]|uniref:MLX-interacting protein-like isoform X1 n=1 Tax=Polyodon spathula TaxID=7913 RepID=UPI001B7E92EE|nr:MLX-interacting protein-like isoform X1 [Polyodon spathula]